MAESIGRVLIVLLELLLCAVPIAMLLVGWRVGAEMLRELRTIRKYLAAISAQIERSESGSEQPR